MKGRRTWKKALAGVLTGTMLIGTLSTVSASGTLEDVDADGWWTNHSEGILLEDGTKTTITFNGTTYSDAADNWDTPIVVLYSADEHFWGGSGISDTAGYTEYYVMRADVYGWDGAGVISAANFEALSYPDDWSAWLTESKSGLEGTIEATLDDSTLTVDYKYGDAEAKATITINPDNPVYLSLSGQMCEVTDIYYESENLYTYESLDINIPSVEIGDVINLNNTQLTLNFTDGNSATTTCYSSCKGYEFDCNLYYNYYYNEETDEEEYTEYYNGSILTYSGIYTLETYVFDCNGLQVGHNMTTFTVDDLKPAETNATALTLDTATSVSTDSYYDTQWYSFTCEESNTYVIASSNYNDCEPYGVLFEVDEDGYLSYVTNSWSFNFKRDLNAGSTYYLLVKTDAYDEYPATFDITVKKAKTIKSISVDTLGVTTYTQYEDSLYDYSTILAITYDDDTTEKITCQGDCAVDSYQNFIYFYVSDGDNTYYAYSSITMDPGTYPIYFYTDCTASGEVVSDSATITVVAPEITVIELLSTDYSHVTESDSYAWFSYTPSTDGNYYFVSTYKTDATTYSELYTSTVFSIDENGDIDYAENAVDENGEYIEAEVEEGTYGVYTLKAGTTYYIRPHYFGYTETIDGDYVSTTYCDATVTTTAYQVNHTHTYDDKLITWTWSDDYSTATAVLRCDACADTVSLVGTVTSVTVDATATTDGSITYTATATYNNVTYTDTKTVTIDATGATTDDGTTTNTEDGTSTDTEDADTEEAVSSESSSSISSSSSDYDFNVTVEETTVSSTEAWSSVTAGEVTLSGDSVTVYTITVDEAYGDDWFSVEIYDANGNYITLNSDGTYWYYGTTGDDIVMTGDAITLEEGMTYTVEVVRDGSDFTVTFYDEDGNELLSYYAANTNIEEVAASHVYAQVGSYTVSAEASGTEVESLYDTEDNGENTEDDSNKTSSGSPKTGDADFALFLLIAAMGCVLLAAAGKKRFVK